jgi:hypothetical protein
MEEVKRQLVGLFPGKWTWELKAQGESSFLAKFPSKVELQRVVASGGADIKGDGVPVGARLKFELWQEKEVGYLQPKVWIRVFGLWKELYEFLELWAVWSMLGSTQIVDMKTTRKNNFGRVLVAVLNPSLIPKQLDVVIVDHYFELDFEVEKVGIDENGEEAEFVWPSGVERAGREDSFGGGQQERTGDRRGWQRSKREDRVAVRRSGWLRTHKVLRMIFISWKEQVQNMSKEEFEAFLRAKADEIRNSAADGVFDELVDKGISEEDVG